MALIYDTATDRTGQIVMEYFILFAMIALLTLIAFSVLDNQVRTGLQGFVNEAAVNTLNSLGR